MGRVHRSPAPPPPTCASRPESRAGSREGNPGENVGRGRSTPSVPRAPGSAQLSEHEPQRRHPSPGPNEKWRGRDAKKAGCCLGQMVHQGQMPGTERLPSPPRGTENGVSGSLRVWCCQGCPSRRRVRVPPAPRQFKALWTKVSKRPHNDL